VAWECTILEQLLERIIVDVVGISASYQDCQIVVAICCILAWQRLK
jgi:hypothetical protein